MSQYNGARFFFFFHRFDPPSSHLVLLLRSVQSERARTHKRNEQSGRTGGTNLDSEEEKRMTDGRTDIRHDRVDPLTFEPQVALLADGRAGTEAHVKSRLTGERTTTVISDPRDPFGLLPRSALPPRVRSPDLAPPPRRRRSQHQDAAPAPCAASFPTASPRFPPPPLSLSPSSPRGTPRERVFHLLHGVLHEFLIADPSASCVTAK